MTGAQSASSMASGIVSGTVSGMASNILQEDAMSDAEKVRENRLRRMAERQGFALTKSRRRDPRATDYGMFMIINAQTNTVVTGTEGTGRPNMSLDDVEQWLG